VSAAWIVVIVVSLATIAIKGAGPLLAGGRELPRAVAGVVSLLAPAVLAALIVTNALASGRHIVIDARAAGVAAAAIALALRAPILVVVVVAAAAAALLRAIGA